MANRLIKAFRNPRLVLIVLLVKFSRCFSDETYLKLLYGLKFEKKLDLKNPKTFNEKLNWLKLYGRKDIYTTMVDKLAVKKYVASLIDEQYIVPLYAQYDTVEEIDLSKLPDVCVFKSNQDSGGAIIYKRGEKNIEDVKVALSKRTKNYYYNNREWPYKNVKTKFFAEQFLDNGTENPVLHDYKFWCFNGEPQIMYVTCKSKEYFENFYDMDFNPLMIGHGSVRRQPEFEKPKQFEIMKDLCRKLSKDIPHVRVDFFLVQGKVYFGEFTFYDWAGLKPFSGDWDEEIGKLLKLPAKS